METESIIVGIYVAGAVLLFVRRVGWAQRQPIDHPMLGLIVMMFLWPVVALGFGLWDMFGPDDES